MVTKSVRIDGIQCVYNRSETTSVKKPSLVILHGWGCNKEQYDFMFTHYEQDFDIIVPDYPGFGKSEEPSRGFTATDYAVWMKQFLDAIDVHDPIMMGHSNGGRIIIRLSELMDFRKAILHDSAGIKPSRSLSYHMKVYSYKAAKWILGLPMIRNRFPGAIENYKKKAGSKDYQQASPVMRHTLSLLVNEDLSSHLRKMKASTLLIWGDKDTATPLKDARKMEQLIPDAGLVIFEGAGHYAFLEQQHRFLRVLDAFLLDKTT